MEQGDLFQLRVFTGPAALGNATAVVATAGDAPEPMAALAARLGFPDTAFLHLPALAPGRWRVDSFSPFEPLRVCTQTLLATHRVLADADRLPGDGRLLAETAAGTVAVERATEGPAQAYVVLPTAAGRRRTPRTPPPPVSSARDPLIVDAGRPRLYVTVDAAHFERAELDPTRVLAYCRAEGVNGVCLVVFAGASVRLRVFTTSLGGREDAATGGAAGGLVGYAETLGRPLADGGTWRVRQGRGGPVTTAELYVRHAATADAVAVGGRAEPVAAGRLIAGVTHRRR